MEQLNQDLFNDQAIEQERETGISGASPTGATCTYTGIPIPQLAADVDGDPGT